MNFLVTGANGFVGSHLVEKLLDRGHTVIGTIIGEHGTLFKDKVIYRYMNLINHQSIEDIFNNYQFDGIFHLAAFTDIPSSFETPLLAFQTTALGTAKLVDEIIKTQGENCWLLVSSSPEVYGRGIGTKKMDETTLYAPVNPYSTCFDKETEILTAYGWKSYQKLTTQDEVATLNLKSYTMEFQKIGNIYIHDYSGKLLHQLNNRLDMCVTPNHRVLASYKRDTNRLYNMRFFKAEDIKGKCIILPITAPWLGGIDKEYFILPEIKSGNQFKYPEKKVPMDDWLRFLGWYLSEGHCWVSGKGNYYVFLSSYYRKQEACDVFRNIGCCNPRNYENDHHILVSNKQLALYVKQFGKSRDKFIPQEFKNLPVYRLQILFKSLIDGDGHKNGRGWGYTSVSKRLADDVQEIALKLGYSANISLDNNGFYHVNIAPSRTIQLNLQKDRSEWVEYTGKVWCVSVPNENVLVRRKGKPFFSGNSKLAADLYVLERTNSTHLNSFLTRAFLTIGPRRPSHFAISSDARQIAKIIIDKQEPIIKVGNLESQRVIIDARDVVEAYYRLMMCAVRGGIKKGDIFHIAGNDLHTIQFYLDRMLHMFGVEAKLEIDPKLVRKIDIPVQIPDDSKVRKFLKWKPSYAIDTTLKDLVNYWIEKEAEDGC